MLRVCLLGLLQVQKFRMPFALELLTNCEAIRSLAFMLRFRLALGYTRTGELLKRDQVVSLQLHSEHPLHTYQRPDYIQ
jgi:hypothetical protein